LASGDGTRKTKQESEESSFLNGHSQSDYSTVNVKMIIGKDEYEQYDEKVDVKFTQI
jgi:hypothetical protein